MLLRSRNDKRNTYNQKRNVQVLQQRETIDPELISKKKTRCMYGMGVRTVSGVSTL